MKKNKRRNIVMLLLLPVLLGTAFLIRNFKRDLVIFPGDGFGWYSDKRSNEGNSEMHTFNYDEKTISYTFTLQKGRPYPYLGIYVDPTNTPYFDLSEFEYMVIELEAVHSKKIPVYVMLEEPGISDPMNINTYRRMEGIIDYTKDQMIYKLAINDFETPDWWFESVKSSKREVGDPLYFKTRSIGMGNCLLLPTGVTEKIALKQIRFEKNNLPTFLWAGGLTAGLYFALFFLGRIFSGVRIRQAYRQAGAKVLTEEESRVISYISHNYNNSALTLELLQEHSGFTESKISTLLKASLNTTFKKYLNQIRIQEARRLLRETDRQVNEIARLVGFETPTNFNRAFKEAEGCTPSEYRNAAKAKEYNRQE